MMLSALNPYRWLIAGAGGLILLVALVFGVNKLIDNAKQAGRDEVQAEWDAANAAAAQEQVKLQAVLADAFNGLDGTLRNTVRTISLKGQDITVRVKRELANEPRYRSADCSLTPGVLNEVNAARSLSGNPAAANVRSGAVPTSGAVARIEFGDVGDGGH